MRLNRLFLLLLCCIYIPNNSLAQANFSNTDYHDRLYHFAKVWGYTKYFHPQVANCTAAWDAILVESIDTLKSMSSNAEFNAWMVSLIDDLGEIPQPTAPLSAITAEFSYNLNLDWFEAEIFTSATKERLLLMRDNYRERSQCNLRLAFNGGNIVFEEDNAFNQTLTFYPTEGERLLALYRYWNIINYFFPYKYQMDQNWEVTLRQFIPPITAAKNALDYHLAFRELTTYINDSHAFFASEVFNEWQGFRFAPFRVGFIEDQTVITAVHTSVANQLKVGDIITAIDGQPIKERRTTIRQYTAASNEPTMQRNINGSLVRGPSGNFELTIDNGEGSKLVTLTRRSFQAYQSLYASSTVAFKKMIARGGCEVGYLDLDVLTPEQVPTAFQTFRDLPAIVVDIRNYPKGTLWTMVDYLYNGPINFSAFTQPNIRYPGLLKFYQHSIGRGGVPYQGRLVILFNETTQSQAEFTIMGLEKHPRALKIGSQTAGADGNISRIYLPGGIETVFTGLGVFYPDGTETQRIGIVPDIEIRPTIQGVRSGQDEMLEFALDCALLEIPFEDETFDVKVFPNPVNNQLSIKNPYPADTDYTIQITDILGRLVKDFTIQNPTPIYDLDFSEFTAGAYLLTFRNSDRIFATEKIIKL